MKLVSGVFNDKVNYTGSPIDLERVSAWLLDLDDAIYHVQTGIHDAIKKKICDTVNASHELDELKENLIAQNLIAADGIVKPSDLGVVAPLFVQHYRQKGLEALVQYVYEVHDVDRSKIAPHPEFVQAIRTLREAGHTVGIYTNGPFGTFDGVRMHANEVLKAIGFEESDFAEDNVVDLLKVDRNPKLAALAPVAADVFRKPTETGFKNACAVLGVQTDRNGKYSHAAYLDDGIYNIGAVKGLDVNGVLIGLNDKPLSELKDAHLAVAKCWHSNTDEAGRHYSITGSIMVQTAEILMAKKSLVATPSFKPAKLRS